MTAGCGECRKDQGFCVYCQSVFSRLHRHIQQKHGDSWRALACSSAAQEHNLTCSGPRKCQECDQMQRDYDAQISAATLSAQSLGLGVRQAVTGSSPFTPSTPCTGHLPDAQPTPGPLGSPDSGPIGPSCVVDDPVDQGEAEHESCAAIRIADEQVLWADDLRYGASSSLRCVVCTTTKHSSEAHLRRIDPEVLREYLIDTTPCVMHIACVGRITCQSHDAPSDLP